MKILIVDRQLGRWDSEWDASLDADAAPRPDLLPLTMGADSALVRPGFPCFLPDFAREGWELRLAPVLRVGKLGKWIETRFAPRYIDALSLASILRPSLNYSNDLKNFKDFGSINPCSFLPIFDGAITPGRFIPLPPEGDAVLSVKGSEPFQFQLRDLRAAETIALISRSVTLKSGDLIIPAMFPAAFPAEIGLDIAANLISPGEHASEEKPMLRARVK